MWYRNVNKKPLYFVVQEVQNGREVYCPSKNREAKDSSSVTMTIRISESLQAQYDVLASDSGRSRNELINMALQYALDNLEFVPGKESSPIGIFYRYRGYGKIVKYKLFLPYPLYQRSVPANADTTMNVSRTVSRVMSWMIIYLGLLLPAGSSNLPES